jgi:hypothetical protein
LEKIHGKLFQIKPFYLYCTEIPIPENQQDMLVEFEAMKDGMGIAGFRLSENWGCSIGDTV